MSALKKKSVQLSKWWGGGKRKGSYWHSCHQGRSEHSTVSFTSLLYLCGLKRMENNSWSCTTESINSNEVEKYVYRRNACTSVGRRNTACWVLPGLTESEGMSNRSDNHMWRRRFQQSFPKHEPGADRQYRYHQACQSPVRQKRKSFKASRNQVFSSSLLFSTLSLPVT